MKKAMVLCSGGVDSATCLALAVEKYGAENVIALAMRYGQKHQKELQAAQALTQYYGVRLIEQDLTPMFAYSDCSLLQHSNQDVPKESYDQQLTHTDGKPVSTYVPFRNGLFLSAAAALALSFECEVIYYGAHADDAAGNAYPDCSEAFHAAMGQAIALGSGNQLTIEAPFVGGSKAQVVKKGLELKVPYQYTWSCYEGEDKPCGKCGTCIDRMRAFHENGVKDPLE